MILFSLSLSISLSKRDRQSARRSSVPMFDWIWLNVVFFFGPINFFQIDGLNIPHTNNSHPVSDKCVNFNLETSTLEKYLAYFNNLCPTIYERFELNGNTVFSILIVFLLNHKVYRMWLFMKEQIEQMASTICWHICSILSTISFSWLFG